MGRRLLKCLLLSVLLLPGGCVSLPVFPKGAMPKAPDHMIFSEVTKYWKWLDCLSVQLAREKNASIKVTVAPIPNVTGFEVADINIPTTLKPFIENSLSRVTSVYEVFDCQSLWGAQGLSQVLPHVGGVPEAVTVTALCGDMIKPDFVFSGSIYDVQVNKSASASAEAYYVGLNGECKVYDVAAQIQVLDARTRRTLLTTALTVRMYSAKQGGSVFAITSGEVMQGELSFVRAPSAIQALQCLSDYLTAATVRDLSSAVLSKSFSFCDSQIEGLNNTKVPIQFQSNGKDGNTLNLRLDNMAAEVCVSCEASPIGILPDQSAWILLQAHASTIAPNRPIGRAYVDKVKVSQLLNGSFCLPKSKLSSAAKIIEVRVFNEKGEILGVVAGDL